MPNRQPVENPAIVTIDGVRVGYAFSSDPTEALAALNQMKANDPERFERNLNRIASSAENERHLRQLQQQFPWMTEDDIVAAMSRGRAGFEPEQDDNMLTRMGVGIGQGARNMAAGARNLALRALPDFVTSQFTNRDIDDFIEKDAEKDRLFDMYRSNSQGIFGISAEDVGSFIPDVVTFTLGAGSPRLGLDLLGRQVSSRVKPGILTESTAGSAFHSVISNAANDPDSAVMLDAAVGGALGFMMPMVMKGLPAIRNLAINTPAAFNALASVAAVHRGNWYLASSSLGTAFWRAAAGGRGVRTQAGEAVDTALNQQAAAISMEAQRALGTAIGSLRVQHQRAAAEGFGMEAYNAALHRQMGQRQLQQATALQQGVGRGFMTPEQAIERTATGAQRTAARQSVQQARNLRTIEEGYEAATQASGQFNAHAFNRALDLIPESQLARMGIFGRSVADIKVVGRVIERMDHNLIPHDQIPQALNALARNPEARRILPQLQRAATDAERLAIIRTMARWGDRGGETARNAILAASTEGAEQLMGDMSDFFGQSGLTPPR